MYLTRPRDQRIIQLWWEPLILSHHPVKFGGHRHCENGDKNIPTKMVILLQMWDICDCIYLLTSVIFIFCKAHDMSCATYISKNNLRNNFYGNFLVCPMKQGQSWSQASWGTNDKNIPKKAIGSLFKKIDKKEKGRGKTIMAIAKLFAFQKVLHVLD